MVFIFSECLGPETAFEFFLPLLFFFFFFFFWPQPSNLVQLFSSGVGPISTKLSSSRRAPA